MSDTNTPDRGTRALVDRVREETAELGRLLKAHREGGDLGSFAALTGSTLEKQMSLLVELAERVAQLEADRDTGGKRQG